MKKVIMRIEKLSGNAQVPQYMSEGSSGMDLYVSAEKDIVLKPLNRALVPTGIRIEIPRGYEAQVRPRSGLALEHGIGVLNSPGTIDSDYRGEIKVIVINLSDKKFVVKPGLRVAQMVLQKVERARVRIVKKVGSSKRGSGGFGHTGVK